MRNEYSKTKNLLREERKIMEYMIKHGLMTSKNVEELLGIKKSRSRELLSRMLKKGLVVKQGQARSTHYVLGDGDD